MQSLCGAKGAGCSGYPYTASVSNDPRFIDITYLASRFRTRNIAKRRSGIQAENGDSAYGDHQNCDGSGKVAAAADHALQMSFLDIYRLYQLGQT
jgi:hypothetical protein